MCLLVADKVVANKHSRLRVNAILSNLDDGQSAECRCEFFDDPSMRTPAISYELSSRRKADKGVAIQNRVTYRMRQPITVLGFPVHDIATGGPKQRKNKLFDPAITVVEAV